MGIVILHLERLQKVQKSSLLPRIMFYVFIVLRWYRCKKLCFVMKVNVFLKGIKKMEIPTRHSTIHKFIKCYVFIKKGQGQQHRNNGFPFF